MAFSHLSSPTKTADTRLVLLMPGVPFPLSPRFEIFLENSFRRLRSAAVRDRFSAERLSGLVPPDIRLEVLPDIVGAIAHFYSRVQLLALDNSLVAPDLRRTGYICFQQSAWCADVNSTGQALRQLEHKTGLPVVLIEIGKCLGDDRFLGQLAERFSFALARAPDATGPGTLMQKVAVIAASRGFVGTSLHGAMLAHAYGAPHVCFSGAALSKVRGFYETCATGRYYSDFAECFGQLDAISECISRPVKRVSDEAAVASKSSDYARINNFVRKALDSVTDQKPRRSSGFMQHVDLQYRRFQTERRLEEQIAAVALDQAAAEQDVRNFAIRLRVAVHRTIKFVWWSITFQLFERYRQRRERLAVQPHFRPPHR